MLIKKILILFAVIGSLIINGCNNDNPKSKSEYNMYNENIIKANKYLLKEDIEKIESYIKRRNWEMQNTGTGLWYMVYEHGKGDLARPGQIVSMKFRVELLDGTVCYSSDSVGLKHFRIGQGGVESGLEEGILLLRTGDKARFIMPPHIAYGLIGDQYKIPPHSIILYELEVVKISGN